jgi:hypothetical protein
MEGGAMVCKSIAQCCYKATKLHTLHTGFGRQRQVCTVWKSSQPIRLRYQGEDHSYPRTLAFCLHYFNYHGLEGEKRLMLGPVGSAMPTKFQREPTRAPDIFTHRMADAYQAPLPAAAR